MSEFEIDEHDAYLALIDLKVLWNYYDNRQLIQQIHVQMNSVIGIEQSRESYDYMTPASVGTQSGFPDSVEIPNYSILQPEKPTIEHLFSLQWFLPSWHPAYRAKGVILGDTLAGDNFRPRAPFSLSKLETGILAGY